jgi:hypothetical protein
LLDDAVDTDDPLKRLHRFLVDGAFAARGAFWTDLDGTLVHEEAGRVFISPEVELGLARIREHGRPVIANTLRFPLSVIRVLGPEWHRATGTDLPLVSMKGSQFGRVTRSEGGETVFEEWGAEVLTAGEIAEVMQGVEGLVGDGVRDLLVFHYPRDWRRGERIWTPDAAAIDAVAAKYRSASAVFSGPVAALRDALLGEPLCMVFLLIDLPEDRRMAYQHTRRSSFFTRGGANKETGARAMAAHLGIDLAASIGAGDAPPDEFLRAVGFAIVVGEGAVEHRGVHDTVRVPSIVELGRLLARIERSLD